MWFFRLLRVLREGRVLGLGLAGSTKCRGSCMMFNKLRGMFWMFRHLEKFREAVKKLVKACAHPDALQLKAIGAEGNCW